GRFNGMPKAFLIDGKEAAREPAQVWKLYNEYHGQVREAVLQREKIKKDDIGAVSRKEEETRLTLKEVQLKHGKDSAQYAAAAQHLQEVSRWAAQEHAGLNAEIASLNRQNDRFKMVLVTADGAEKVLPLADIVRAYPANQVSFSEKLAI